jgi:hypothetical protein
MIFSEVDTFNSIVSSVLKGLSLNKWRQDFFMGNFYVVSLLRDDANLRYKFTCEYSGKGRPPQPVEKVNLEIWTGMFLLNFKSMTTLRLFMPLSTRNL